MSDQGDNDVGNPVDDQEVPVEDSMEDMTVLSETVDETADEDPPADDGEDVADAGEDGQPGEADTSINGTADVSAEDAGNTVLNESDVKEGEETEEKKEEETEEKKEEETEEKKEEASPEKKGKKKSPEINKTMLILQPVHLPDLMMKPLHKILMSSQRRYNMFFRCDRTDNMGTGRLWHGNIRLFFETEGQATHAVRLLMGLRFSDPDFKVFYPRTDIDLLQQMRDTDKVKRSLEKKAISEAGTDDQNSRSLFVNSIPPDCTEEVLKCMFTTATSIVIPTEGAEDMGNFGYAVLEFESHQDAVDCLVKNRRVEINNVRIQLTQVPEYDKRKYAKEKKAEKKAAANKKEAEKAADEEDSDKATKAKKGDKTPKANTNKKNKKPTFNQQRLQQARNRPQGRMGGRDNRRQQQDNRRQQQDNRRQRRDSNSDRNKGSLLGQPDMFAMGGGNMMMGPPQMPMMMGMGNMGLGLMGSMPMGMGMGLMGMNMGMGMTNPNTGDIPSLTSPERLGRQTSRDRQQQNRGGRQRDNYKRQNRNRNTSGGGDRNFNQSGGQNRRFSNDMDGNNSFQNTKGAGNQRRQNRKSLDQYSIQQQSNTYDGDDDNGVGNSWNRQGNQGNTNRRKQNQNRQSQGAGNMQQQQYAQPAGLMSYTSSGGNSNFNSSDYDQSYGNQQYTGGSLTGTNYSSVSHDYGHQSVLKRKMGTDYYDDGSGAKNKGRKVFTYTPSQQQQQQQGNRQKKRRKQEKDTYDYTSNQWFDQADFSSGF